MKHNIGMLVEIPYKGSKVKDILSLPNARTDTVLFNILDATMYDFDCDPSMYENKHDFYFYIIPKTNLNSLDIIERCISENNKAKHILYQEGPVNNFQEWPIVFQKKFIELLEKFDMIYAHNQADTFFWRGVTSTIVANLFTPINIEYITQNKVMKKQEKVMIGGNCVRWYNGSLSYLAAKPMGIPITLPSMGRRQENEDTWKNVKVLPYLNMQQWIKELSTHKYAIHLMPTYAAGSFHLACAILGIPCVGSYMIDTQRICFPELSINDFQVETARDLLLRLQSDTDFYNECSLTALNNSRKYFSSENVMSIIEGDLDKL